MTKDTQSNIPPSVFEFDRLAPELVHLIFSFLERTEAPKFRLLCRNVAQIGLQYIIPEVHVMLTMESLERLKAIAKHPRVSEHVTTIFYEADCLREYENQREWKESIAHGLLQIPRHPRNDATERALRSYYRELKKVHCESNLRYREYQETVIKQNAIKRSQIDLQALGEALTFFPNIRSIVLSVDGAQRAPTLQLQRAFCGTLADSKGVNCPEKPCGLSEFTSMLLRAHASSLHLQNLSAGFVSWKFLEQEDCVLAALRRSVSDLKTINLNIIAGYLRAAKFVGMMDSALCAESLSNGHLTDYLSSATHLTSMKIGFTEETYQRESVRINLRSIVGDFHWPYLRVVAFSKMSIEREHMVEFCTRHSSTLKDLSLNHPLLEGEWWLTILEVRRVLTLKTCNLSGYIDGHGLNPWKPASSWGHIQTGVGLIIADYIQAKGMGDITFLEYLEDENILEQWERAQRWPEHY